MTNQIQPSPWTVRAKIIVGTLALAQLAAAIIIGSGHLLANDQQSFLAPIALTATIPVLTFLAAYGLSPRFRSFILAQDLRTLTMLQHWRVVGFTFLALYAFNALPGAFAWPAGAGDVAIGLAAPFIVMQMDRDPDFVTSASFVRFNLLGLLDFAVAITAAGLTSGAFPALTPDGLTSAPMDVWPLNLFPSFIVPAFIILHLTTLLKVRALRRAGAAVAGTAAQAA